MFSNFFKKKKKSAITAKERLRITIESDRNNAKEHPFMEEMKKEIMEVIKKYTKVEKIEVNQATQEGIDAISIDVELSK